MISYRCVGGLVRAVPGISRCCQLLAATCDHCLELTILGAANFDHLLELVSRKGQHRLQIKGG